MSVRRVVTPGTEISSWSDQKWARGMSHISAISEVASAWGAAAHVWVDLALSEDRHVIDATLRIDASPPLEAMALRLGDAVHCFRSAFDSLAWSLCHIDGASPAQPKRVYYPCATTEAKWMTAAAPLASMPAEYLERIRQTQPFVTGPGSPLQLLVALNNQDKHRGMITGRANPATLTIGVDTGGATGSRNGITNGFVLSLLNEQHSLLDGIAYARMETSVPVGLTRDRAPVGLEYFVNVDHQEYPLVAVQTALSELQRFMVFVRQGDPSAVDVLAETRQDPGV